MKCILPLQTSKPGYGPARLSKNIYPLLIEVASCAEKKISHFFNRLVLQTHKFFGYSFPRPPPFGEHSSIVGNVLDPSALALNHCGYSYIEG